MIQAITNTSLTAYVQTEDTRINTAVSSDYIQFLVKFTNDMSGAAQYAYPEDWIYNRYSKMFFSYNATPDVYLGRIDLKPAGYWKYEVYEVSWGEAPVVGLGNAPVTENDVLAPAATDKGIVQGLVTKGKVLVSEQSGTEEVQYIQNANSVLTLTIAYGGTGYGLAPLVTIVGDCINAATATCTVNAGSVDTVTIVYAGNGYTENPTVTLSSVGETETANIIANIEPTNYIYNG